MDGYNASDPRTIREMFSRIARRYDLNNRLHSLWRDQGWRRRAALAAELRGNEAVLDVACGTGDLTAMLARDMASLTCGRDARDATNHSPCGRAAHGQDARATSGGRIVGLDYCEPMLAIARRKYPGLDIQWVAGDAMALPFDAGEFDVASIAFGLRNLPDTAGALAQLRRVLKPGGRLVVLEFSGGRRLGVRGAILRLYTQRIMPRTAAMIARDRSGAYDYLFRSTQGFATAYELADQIRAAGFCDVSTRRLTLGIASLHLARRE
jgi:demethylmenaquinone methyltransferase/2-methoxy-6-polyprenyl-1,4-benzoquinol methylase